MQWIKLYAGTAINPKFKVIARDAKVHIGDALGAWLLILDEASKADGDASGLNLKIIEAALELKQGKAELIISAMQELDMLDGMIVKGWQKRQAAAGNTQSSAYERVKKYREKQRSGQTPSCNGDDNGMITDDNADDNGMITDDNADDNGMITDDNADDNGMITDDNADDNGMITDDNALRIEKRREDKKRELKAEDSPEASSGPKGGGKAGANPILLPEVQPGTDPVYITLPVVGNPDKPEYQVRQSRVDYYAGLYPGVEMRQEFSKMLGWLNANPKNRKTEGGIERFINGWLAKAQNSSKPGKEGGQQQNARPAAPTVYQQQMQDEAAMARMCLEMRRRERENEQRANTAIAC